MNDQPRLDFEAADPLEQRDAQARVLATDPTRNVALEASAGTGKTRVLVDRYVALLLAGAKPRNILAITFTRKAAAEMRRRILDDLTKRHREKSLSDALWRELRESITDISISTIDAFCLALLREFPLEADVDPGFDLADETETPGLIGEALDQALRIGRTLSVDDPDVALLFAELGEFRLREGLARLLDRRLVAWDALGRFLRGADAASTERAVERLVKRLREALAVVPGGLETFIRSGPDAPFFDLLANDLRSLLTGPAPSAAMAQILLQRVSEYLLTRQGEPRKRVDARIAEFRSRADYDRHNAAVVALGPYLVAGLDDYRREVNVVLARAVRRLYAIALDRYERTLRKHGVLDFSDILQRTLALLGQMDDFSRSRYKLEARYQHVLVDEFQDTSRAQWALVERLVRSWAEGSGLGDSNLATTIFIVGDRKQSIYGFRDAEVAVLDEAAHYISALRPGSQVRMAITRSFRAVKELLALVNDVFSRVEKAEGRPDAFRYTEDDEFPTTSAAAAGECVLGIAASANDERQAETVADEIASLLTSGAVIRDRDSGLRRSICPGDIAILFRARETHRLFQEALTRRGVPFYVYKGLGFFDADEIKDLLALLGYLARPDSQLRAAALLRSRFVRLSDVGLKVLAPRLAESILDPTPPALYDALDQPDRQRLALARKWVPRWLGQVDRVAPAELLDRVIAESAYCAELAGPSHRQARENIKKLRALVRRIQNRGYATMGRIVDHFSELAAGGDESNAIVDAADAVNLMTVHAAKGLEFPIVFVVNLARGSGGTPDAIRIVAGHDHGAGAAGADPPEAKPRMAAVSIGGYQSEADEDLEARESEEAKRLLYVAMTRARDRLYLTTTVTSDGRFVPAKGSLGRPLPKEVAALFDIAAAAASGDVVSWNGASSQHHFRVVRASETVIGFEPARIDAETLQHDFAPLVARDPVRRVAATQLALESSGARRSIGEWAASSVEIGALVHRALQAGLLDRDPPIALGDHLRHLLRYEERALIGDVDAFLDRAVRACEAIVSRPEVARLLGRGADKPVRLHEVPFSYRQPDGTIIRGAIDCIVKYPDGRVDVLEFKTGVPQAAHREQLSVYVNAARVLFPGAPIQGHLIYAEQLSGVPGV